MEQKNINYLYYDTFTVSFLKLTSLSVYQGIKIELNRETADRSAFPLL